MNSESIAKAILGPLYIIILILIPALATLESILSSLYYSLLSGRFSEKYGDIIQPVIKIYFLAESKESHKLEK